MNKAGKCRTFIYLHIAVVTIITFSKHNRMQVVEKVKRY